jgi:Putative adhesin
MLRLHVLAVSSVTLMLSAAAAQAQYPVDAPAFDWSGAVPAGATLRIANVDGEIRVSPSRSGQARVHGERTRVTSGSRALVFDVVQSGSDVTICARYREGRCDEMGAHGGSGDYYGKSPAANLTVELPAGVKLAAKTGDGRIDIKDAGADVNAKSGDGEITIAGAAGTVDAKSGDGDITLDAVKGAVSAHTGDGNIRVSAGTAPVKLTSGDGTIEVHVAAAGDGQSIEAHTGDGSITVYLPSSFSGEVEASTGDGSLESDFPLTLNGHMDRRHMHGTVGSAGSNAARVMLSTGDGDVRLKKG